jgi:hypothetical protein
MPMLIQASSRHIVRLVAPGEDHDPRVHLLYNVVRFQFDRAGWAGTRTLPAVTAEAPLA